MPTHDPLATALRRFYMALIRLYYPVRRVTGAEHIPTSGPVLVLANHPNGLLDPLLLRLALRHPLAFLAKSTLFKNPASRLAMRAFSTIPIYRPRDGEDAEQNNKTFDLCRDHLHARGWLALFPEGTSHSDPGLKPLKTGAARIALLAESTQHFSLNLQILPVGLTFLQKDTFRSHVAVHIGPPFPLSGLPDLADLPSMYASDPHAAAKRLTAHIHAALARVTLEAPDSTLWRGLLAVASWTSPQSTSQSTPNTSPEAYALTLSRALQSLLIHDPTAADALISQTQALISSLQSLGIHDPLSLDPAHLSFIDPSAPTPSLPTLLTKTLALSALSLPALLFAWLPYRLIRPLSIKLAAGHDDVVSTVKFLLGSTVLTLTFLLEALTIGLLSSSWLWGLLALLLIPLSGLCALLLDESLHTLSFALKRRRLSRSQPDLLHHIHSQRAALADAITSTLSRTLPTAPNPSPPSPINSPRA